LLKEQSGRKIHPSGGAGSLQPNSPTQNSHRRCAKLLLASLGS
jgi:hypothetical protein